MKKLLATLTIIAAVGLNAADGAASYAKCIGCHGAKGEKVALGKSKIISNMKVDEIVAALKGYKDGSYGGAMKGLMKGQVANMSDDQMDEVANLIGTK